MKIVVDMNLPRTWIETLTAAGHDARHWSDIGDPRAKDTDILKWAQRNGYIIFTHDLDFGTLLTKMNLSSPSVVQIRALDITPSTQGAIFLTMLSRCEQELQSGALITIEEQGRVRIRPLR